MSGNRMPDNKSSYELKSFCLCKGDDPQGLFIKFLVDDSQTGSEEKMYFHYSISNAKEEGKDRFRDFLKEIEQKIDEMP